MSDIDTSNDFLVGYVGGNLAPLRPVAVRDRQQAYRTAAWLVEMAEILDDDGTEATFEQVREAIRSL